MTSPNDPIFMFHHANLDRNAKQWMANNEDRRAAAYGYPTSGTIDGRSEGMFLADVASSAFPFTAQNLGLDATIINPSAALTSVLVTQPVSQPRRRTTKNKTKVPAAARCSNTTRHADIICNLDLTTVRAATSTTTTNCATKR